VESWTEIHWLINAARGGDREAFEQLLKRFDGVVERTVEAEAGQHLRRRMDAEDLVQEAFLRAFQSIGQFRGESEASFRSWLETVSRHVVQDAGRRLGAFGGQRRCEVSIEQGTDEGASSWTFESELAATGATPSQAARRDERFDRLKRVLATLAEDHSRVILLARVQGLPIKEVARRMDRTPEATSMLLMRALIKLREAFGPTESLHLPDRSLLEEGPGPDERGRGSEGKGGPDGGA